jgi:hypothetical protein
MNNFDVAKWNKQRYLAEANLLESKAQEAATAIDKILDEIDPPGILPEDLGEAIAIIVKKGYQAELQEKFMDALHKKLGYPKDLNEAKDESYMISKSGSKSYPHYVLEKPDGSKQIDMMFDSPEEAKKYADKNNIRVSSKTGYNMNEAKEDKEITGLPGTVTIGGGKSGILIPTNQGDYIYYVTDNEYNAFINAGGNAQKLMATIFLKSGKAKPYKPKYNPMASLGGGKGYHIDEAKDDFYPDSPEALRQAIQTAKEILEKNKDNIKIIADKYEGQPGKSREMMDELDALIDVDLEGIAFQEYVSNKVKGVLGKALFRYYASQNPELSKMMR